MTPKAQSVLAAKILGHKRESKRFKMADGKIVTGYRWSRRATTASASSAKLGTTMLHHWKRWFGGASPTLRKWKPSGTRSSPLWRKSATTITVPQ